MGIRISKLFWAIKRSHKREKHVICQYFLFSEIYVYCLRDSIFLYLYVGICNNDIIKRRVGVEK